ncbi:MAG: YabP/YqfC family sporulation protein [Lachnospiraceae bacterium]|nr:YabP/YqfC family sporulation protein [Lachnospiraceae bacterium]
MYRIWQDLYNMLFYNVLLSNHKSPARFIDYPMRHKKKNTRNKFHNPATEHYEDGLRQKLLAHELPVEALTRDTVVTCIGQCGLWVENYKSILEYGERGVTLQAGNCVVCVCGERLVISHYMKEHMMIRGHIQSITYR